LKNQGTPILVEGIPFLVIAILAAVGFNDKSFKRESASSLAQRFGVTKQRVEQVRQTCNKAVRKNIPGVMLCDFSEERWSALVELSLAFL
jgi:undecaprenyl pyrophosphate synthase